MHLRGKEVNHQLLSSLMGFNGQSACDSDLHFFQIYVSFKGIESLTKSELESDKQI